MLATLRPLPACPTLRRGRLCFAVTPMCADECHRVSGGLQSLELGVVLLYRNHLALCTALRTRAGGRNNQDGRLPAHAVCRLMPGGARILLPHRAAVLLHRVTDETC